MGRVSDSSEEERIEGHTSILSIKPGPSDWESRAPNGAKNDVMGR